MRTNVKRVLLSLHCGCKVNQYETNAMKQDFIKNGYEIVEFNNIAKIYIVNTCTVTNISDKKSRQILRRTKEKNKESILVVTGCYAQVAKQELEKIEEIDIILGNNEKNEILKHVEGYLQKKQKEKIITDIMCQKEFLDFGNTTYTEKTRAVIKIQDGCDRFCSYCIIPYARGRVRSRKIENIIEEIKNIVKIGIKEVVITGIHVASYGKDFQNGTTLIKLLEEINKIDGLKRIRLSSIEPTIITQQFINRLIKLEKICDHFHLSLQSGCNETLKRMNRKYTKEEFEEAVNLLKKAYPEVSLTTDIIVGFPKETKEEFEETYKFLQKINFYKMHIFKYSPKKGTKAAEMECQIDEKTKEERSQQLIQLSKKNQEEYNKKYIGKQLEVLLEETQGGYIKGHTTNYILVCAETKMNMQNKIVKIKIQDLKEDKLIGTII
ncbi:MAG: tRNA (N(6)-L-threonylcarbamoyladenosine(37)-C(2))-methylthiotransferase MtaB [Clostridia bacterium]|jgi:threonylcarbamoyladenosine tRNA methylthiotransferase MtaB|nr:tRNA (N(6)-L-threonylcarbamoyladenosine(37)-C(2))-methylthiotransferase MtaB [Clostridia bacterium]